MTVNNDAIQETMEDVVANVEPSLIEKVVNNQNLQDIVCDAGVVGGCLFLGYATYKGVRYHAIPWVKKQFTTIKEKIDSKKQTNPVEELKEVVEAEIVA